jgi:hypothetical protein
LATWLVWDKLEGSPPGREKEAEMVDTQTNGAAKKVTKLDAVERAMQALGGDAKRDELRAFIKHTFGYEMSLDHISNAKGDLAKRAKRAKAKKAAASRVAALKPVAEAAIVQHATQAPSSNGKGRPASISVEDVLALRTLVDRVGAENLRKLIAAFER